MSPNLKELHLAYYSGPKSDLLTTNKRYVFTEQELKKVKLAAFLMGFVAGAFLWGVTFVIKLVML